MTRRRFAFAIVVVSGLGGAFLTNTVLKGQAVAPPAVPKELTSYREIVKAVLPAVVSIQAETKAVVRRSGQTPRVRPPIEGLPEEFRKFFEDFDFRSPEELPHQSFGSGFVIDPKGVILTNYHVVSGANKLTVTLQDGSIYTSSDFKGDRKNDLAIVRINAKSPLPHLELGDSDQMEIGDRVLAIGAPFKLTGSVTAGIISAKGRSGVNMERSVYEDYLQTDAAINPGNSGGPLVNLEGKVIGINTAIRTGSGGWQGVGFAITSNVARNIANQLIRNGVVHRGYLGVTIADKHALEPEIAARLGVQEGGVLVTGVVEGAPAGKAGIRENDVITSIAGKPVADARELQRIVGSLPIKKPVEIGLTRDGRPMSVQVTIGEQPENLTAENVPTERSSQSPEEEESINVDKFGLSLADLTPELAKRYGYKEDTKGVLITNVRSGSAADEAGLRKGLLIARIDKKPVDSAAEAKETLQRAAGEAGGVLLQLHAPGGRTAFRLLKPETAEK